MKSLLYVTSEAYATGGYMLQSDHKNCVIAFAEESDQSSLM